MWIIIVISLEHSWLSSCGTPFYYYVVWDVKKYGCGLNSKFFLMFSLTSLNMFSKVAS